MASDTVSGNISPIWGEAPTVPIETKICMERHLADIITCAKFQDEIFWGYDFTEGRISHFFLFILHGPYNCSAIALPVISRIWGEAPAVPIETKICMERNLADVITCAKFHDEIFRGYDFTGGRISHFSYSFCMGLTTVALLQRCL